MATNPSASGLALRWLLPVGIGVVVGLAVHLPSGTKPEAASLPVKQEEAKIVLEDEPTRIKLAALAGRTTEARAKVAALIGSGAKDGEIAEWLAPILIADPAALEDLVANVPEDRRTALVRLALREIIALHPDSVWELIRASPMAAAASRANAGDKRYRGLEIIASASDSPLAAEVLFDPANGFSTDEISRFFRFGTRSEASVRKVLEEWIAGRWQGEPPRCVQSAWVSLRWRNEPEIRELIDSLPEALLKKAGEFEALALMEKKLRDPLASPTAEELNTLGAEELASLADDRGMAGKPLPLELLAALPEDKRGKTLENYLRWSYPFGLQFAREEISRVDSLQFSRAERDILFRQASEYEWNSQGELASALALAARITDGKIRGELEAGILEELAQYDPRGALAHVQNMPAGELRDKIEKLATESLP